MEIVIKTNADAIAQEGAQRFTALAQKAISSQGRFSVALSGGETPRQLYAMLGVSPYRDNIDWQNVHLFWGDERFVPPDDPESNYRMAQATLLSQLRSAQIALPPHNICRVPTVGLTPAEAAEQYSQTMTRFFGGPLPRFDLILLGLGPDGHTASLFPEHVHEAHADIAPVIVVRDAPKPPPVRLSLTLESINRAANIIFLVTGCDKAQIVQKVLQSREPKQGLPAQRVQPTNGHLVWLLDEAAGQYLHR